MNSRVAVNATPKSKYIKKEEGYAIVNVMERESSLTFPEPS